MSTIEHVELLKDLIQQAVDRGATSVEQVHQSIADLPFETLERLGLFKETSKNLHEKHRRSIGMVYDAIRTVNREIGQLISDQFELIEDGRHVEAVLRRKEGRAQAGASGKGQAKTADD
ncbi:MAG TPA: hypothetical protein VFQ88_01390 [Nevskiaceae bacterium]|nr:hypothetical protein [Nevskiaceae bacterium]